MSRPRVGEVHPGSNLNISKGLSKFELPCELVVVRVPLKYASSVSVTSSDYCIRLMRSREQVPRCWVGFSDHSVDVDTHRVAQEQCAGMSIFCYASRDPNSVSALAFAIFACAK